MLASQRKQQILHILAEEKQVMSGDLSQRFSVSEDSIRRDLRELAAEGEDIEVLEWPLEQALEAIRNGEIVDAKTIMLLQHLALNTSTLLAL